MRQELAEVGPVGKSAQMWGGVGGCGRTETEKKLKSGGRRTQGKRNEAARGDDDDVRREGEMNS